MQLHAPARPRTLAQILAQPKYERHENLRHGLDVWAVGRILVHTTCKYQVLRPRVEDLRVFAWVLRSWFEDLLVFAWVLRGFTLKPAQVACNICHQRIKPMQIQGIAC